MGIAKILAHETKNEKGVPDRGEAAAKKQLQGRGGCRKIREGVNRAGGEGTSDKETEGKRRERGCSSPSLDLHLRSYYPPTGQEDGRL